MADQEIETSTPRERFIDGIEHSIPLQDHYLGMLDENRQQLSRK